MHENNELTTQSLLDPYIITYVVAGFLWGHVALHHDITKLSHLARAWSYPYPSSTVLVGAILFIALALIHHIGTYHLGCRTGRTYK